MFAFIKKLFTRKSTTHTTVTTPREPAFLNEYRIDFYPNTCSFAYAKNKDEVYAQYVKRVKPTTILGITLVRPNAIPNPAYKAG